jgi:5-methylcytosine-specific restriction endonuclease McrA
MEQATKLCIVCNKPFHRHRSDTDKLWASKRFCSYTCAEKVNRRVGRKEKDRNLIIKEGRPCVICGETNPDLLIIDHIIPLAIVGANAGDENLQVMCKKCHERKTRKDMILIRKERLKSRAKSSSY